MLVSEALTLLGGVATRDQLIDCSSRAEVDEALATGTIVVLARGRYAAATVGAALGAAHRITGTVGLLSAALHHGWAVKTEPAAPQVVVPRGRKLTRAQRSGVEVRWLDLGPDDVVGGVTSEDRTLVDCGRFLPEDEALCVFDSALRAGYGHRRLVALMRDVRGPHARRMRQLAARATAKAANPFETCLRWIADDVTGLTVRPQVPLYAAAFLGQPDLVDVELRIVVEADSFEWHGGRADLARDARRYNRMVVNGWLVLRFAWEDVMFDQDFVREILAAAVAERTKMCPACRSAA